MGLTNRGPSNRLVPLPFGIGMTRLAESTFLRRTRVVNPVHQFSAGMLAKGAKAFKTDQAHLTSIFAQAIKKKGDWPLPVPFP